eukprot:3063699-Lingulodinium_polyedra.AAC.1
MAKRIGAAQPADGEQEAKPKPAVDVDGLQKQLDWFVKAGYEDEDPIVAGIKTRLAELRAKRDAGKAPQ